MLPPPVPSRSAYLLICLTSPGL